jgi:DNA-binding MarR family transcriptional regulator
MPTVHDLRDADYRALAGFRRELRTFLSFSETAARSVGLEPRQHQLLLALRAIEGEPSVQTLADALALKHHSVVELLDRLEAGGLIKRERSDQDRRRAKIAITERGSNLLRKLSRAHLDELRDRAPSLVAALTHVLRASRRA